MNNAEMARLREQTRADCAGAEPARAGGVPSRYSHIAHYLRQELSGFEAPRMSFAKSSAPWTRSTPHATRVWRLVETMSGQQRARYERQRETAIREALARNGIRPTSLPKNRSIARPSGLPRSRTSRPGPDANLPAHKASEAKRQKILT